MTYFNTTQETGETLKAYRGKAKTQDNQILIYIKTCTDATELVKTFRDKEDYTTTSSTLWKFLFDKEIPITSIRRSVSNLVRDGRLIYTGTYRMGMFGRREREFKLAKK